MIALVYASLLICTVLAPTITPLGLAVLGILALLIFAYLIFAEWELARLKYAIPILVLLALLAPLVPAQACTGPACCVRYGVPAVCRSPVIEARAKAIVMRRCPRFRSSDVDGWIFSYQMNRGPYERAADLAGDVLRASCMKKGRASCPSRPFVVTRLSFRSALLSPSRSHPPKNHPQL